MWRSRWRHLEHSSVAFQQQGSVSSLPRHATKWHNGITLRTLQISLLAPVIQKHAVWQWPPCCNSAMLHHHRPRAFRPARHGVPESNPEAHRPKGSNLDGEASSFLINNIIRPHVMTPQRCLFQCRGLDCVWSRQTANNAAVQELADVPWPASALGCRHLGRIRHNRLAHR